MKPLAIAFLLMCSPLVVCAQQVTARLVVQRGNTDGVGIVAIAPNGKLALTSRGLTTGKDYSICLWEVATGREIRRLTNHTDSVRALAFSPDSRFAASASNDKTARIWNVETGAEILRLDHPDWVLSLAFSPDGKYLLSGTNANSLWLRDVDGGELAMIIDACHAAAAVENKEFKPGPMGSRGLGQLAYDKGMRILTATQSGDFALESERLKQGLLSYALLHAGLIDDKADFEPAGDGQITLREWLDYGVVEVPRLYDEVKNGRRDLIFKDVNKRSSEALAGDAKQSPFAQQPSLFDFKRKTQSATVAQVKEKPN